MFVMNNNYPITRAVLKLNHFYLTPSDFYQRTTSAGPILDLISIRLSDATRSHSKKNDVFAFFFHLLFKMSYFVKYCGKYQEKKSTRQK